MENFVKMQRIATELKDSKIQFLEFSDFAIKSEIS
jgi:hypothetical protein